MMTKQKPGDLYNKFQKKRKNAGTTKMFPPMSAPPKSTRAIYGGAGQGETLKASRTNPAAMRVLKRGDFQKNIQKSFHMKKKKSVGDQPSMAGWRPTPGGFGYPKPAAKPATSRLAPKSVVGNTTSTKFAKKKHSKNKKNWIAGAIKKPGALHRELGVKADNKIPAKTLSKAAKKGGLEGKRARLAQTLKSFHHKKKKSDMKHCKSCEC